MLHFYEIFLYIKPWTIFIKFLHFLQNSRWLPISPFFWISNFCLHFQNLYIFPSLIPKFPCFQSDGIQSTWFSLSWGSHLLRGATKSSWTSSPQHRILHSPVVLFMAQELLSYVSGPLGRLWARTGVRSGKADSQRQFDPCTSRTMESEHFYFLVPMGRNDVADRLIFRNYGITRASRSAWRSVGKTVLNQCQGSGP